MTRRQAIVSLMLIWAVLWGGAFVAFAVIEPTGDSFVRGVNRLMWALGFQGAAALVAVVLFRESRGLPPGTVWRRLAWGPLVLAGLFLLALLSPFVAVWLDRIWPRDVSTAPLQPTTEAAPTLDPSDLGPNPDPDLDPGVDPGSD